MKPFGKIINFALAVFFLYLANAWAWGWEPITQTSAICSALIASMYFFVMAASG